MIDYERAVMILNEAFDIVRRGENGPFLAENTLALLGIREPIQVLRQIKEEDS